MSGELTRQQVNTELAAVLIKRTPQRVAQDCKISINDLLDMMEGKREIPRRVLRYLGIKKVIGYVWRE